MQYTSSLAEHPANSTPNTDAEPPLETPSLLADVAALIAEIEAATAGNPALDARIHFGFRIAAQRSTDLAALLIEEGITWPTVETVLEESIPPFTSSLDAALEGEDISFVIRSDKRQRWGAMQKARCGEEILAWAATEALARRLAAIRAWQVDLAKSAEQSPAPANPSPANDEPAQRPTAGDDWEVTF